jgi:beta-lactamase regulating signal transducer with metallopeptidase domain
MNDLGVTLTWAAVQVTVVALAAAVWYPLASRRGPAALTAALFPAVIVALTLAAFCPLPSWWAWQLPAAPPVVAGPNQATTSPEPAAPPSEESRPSPKTVPAPAPAAAGERVARPASFLARVWNGLRPDAVPSSRRDWRWPAVVAAVFLAGAGFCLARFLFALAAVHAWRRRSRPIDDPALLGLTAALRADMGCRRPVEVRESPDLAAPATAGWRRPLILLPPDWRAWDEAQRRAVLSHELAHVRRSDYVAWLVARVSVALHFYHPLVYWLANRLRLQQELAADALGARFAGGRRPYLLALAQLALRQDDRPSGWPAPMFLPSRGTLMRRIQMLRAKEHPPGRPLSWPGRAVLVALLGSLALGVSALRGPAVAADPAEEAKAAARLAAGVGARAVVPTMGPVPIALDFGYAAGKNPEQVGPGPEPFDISCLPPDAPGVLAFRPAAVLGRPEMKKYADTINQSISKALKQLRRPQFNLPIEAIDQVVSQIVFRTDKTRKEGQTAVFSKVTMVRTVKDFDGRKLLKTWLPDEVEVHYHGKVYYRVTKLPHPELMQLFERDFCYFFPDGRTAVFDTEENVRRLLRGGKKPPPAWAEGWKQVERGLVAFAMDNRDKRWLLDRTEKDPPSDALFLHSTSLVFGAEYSDGFVLRGFARCATEEAGAKVVRAVNDLTARGRKELEEEARKKPPRGRDLVAHRLTKGFLDHSQVEQQGTSVRWHSQIPLSFTELAALISEGAK